MTRRKPILDVDTGTDDAVVDSNFHSGKVADAGVALGADTGRFVLDTLMKN